MKILSIDTSTRYLNVCILEDDEILFDLFINTGVSHSKNIMGAITQGLSFLNVSLHELDGFAVTTGPGSFVGLRIGISTVKGLAYVHNKPVVGINTLYALAHQAPATKKKIYALLDARRNEVYYAVFFNDNGQINKLKPEGVGKVENIFKKDDESIFIIGSGGDVYQRQIEEIKGQNVVFADPYNNILRGPVIARLGLIQLESGNSDDIFTLAPYYIRRSDAEMSLKTESQNL